MYLERRDRDTLRVYDSLAEYLDEGERAARYMEQPVQRSRPHFREPEAMRAAIRKARHGEPAFVQAAERMLAEFALQLETRNREWNPSPAGAYPVVPEALAGSPTPMRMLGRQSERGPIGIYINTGISGGMQTDVILQRGVALIALAQWLERTRPVELFIVDTSNGTAGVGYSENHVMVIPLGLRPLDLSVAGAVFGLPEFERALNQGILGLHHKPWAGNWNPGYFQPGWVQKFVGLGPDDLYVAGMYLEDRELIANPLAWLRKQVAKFEKE